jgi:hypothetical protein
MQALASYKANLMMMQNMQMQQLLIQQKAFQQQPQPLALTLNSSYSNTALLSCKQTNPRTAKLIMVMILLK